jgi:GNAT superfamily N-acetyltransferase
MKVEELHGKNGYKTFRELADSVYRNNQNYRGTEGSIEKMLMVGPTAFHNHATCRMFVLRDGNDLTARFALIHDKLLPNYVQVSFFEAHEGLGNIFPLIRSTIRNCFPDVPNVLVGLNGHLNYGAGFLLNRFDEPPVFGLPYTQPYYPGYFSELYEKRMFSFRFPMDKYSHWAASYDKTREIKGLTVRYMNKYDIKNESAIYTRMNNLSFQNHPYWANRMEKEDLELFNPFRFLLSKENLIFAEVDNKPVGFFLWYPDFNQLVKSQRDLNLLDVIRYRFKNTIDTYRFTEIGIVPEYQGSPVAMAMLNKALPKILEQGFTFCEGGFIFEENRASIAFVNRILQRAMGERIVPYRRYAVYETKI